jgi:uncharacterized protein YndB with AHSA1/START domain
VRTVTESDTAAAPAVDRATVTIAAPPEAVWDLVTDISRMGEWSPETTSCRWLGRRKGPEVGARFVGFNKRGWARWATTVRVVEAERGRSFAFRVDGIGVRWGYVFEPEGDGTRLSETRDLSGARIPVVKALSVFVGGMDGHADELRAGMQATLERIKAAAEAG